MKKIFALLLAGMMLLTLCACGKSEAAQAVDDMITAINTDNLDEGTISAIAQASAAYQALSEEDQADVELFEDLETKSSYAGSVLLSALNTALEDLDFQWSREICDYLLMLPLESDERTDIEDIKESFSNICYDDTSIGRIEVVVSTKPTSSEDPSHDDRGYTFYKTSYDSAVKGQRAFEEYLEYATNYFTLIEKDTGKVVFEDESGRQFAVIAINWGEIFGGGFTLQVRLDDK